MEKSDSILIVDDDLEIRRLLVDYLARNGFAAIAARDGREMWQMLERHAVDLIPAHPAVIDADYAEEVTEYLVDEADDPTFARTRSYGPDYALRRASGDRRAA